MIGLLLQTVSVSLQLVNVGNHSEVSLCIHATAALFLRFCIFHSFIGILCRSFFFPTRTCPIGSQLLLSFMRPSNETIPAFFSFTLPLALPSIQPLCISSPYLHLLLLFRRDTSSTALPQSIANSLSSFIYSRKINIGTIE